MSKIRIVTENNVTRFYQDDIEIERVRSFEIKQDWNGLAILNLEIIPLDLELTGLADVRIRKLDSACFYCKENNDGEHIPNIE
jgi:hypothetical protein